MIFNGLGIVILFGTVLGVSKGEMSFWPDFFICCIFAAMFMTVGSLLMAKGGSDREEKVSSISTINNSAHLKMQGGLDMFCPKCGTKVKDTYKYCYKCGNKLEVKSYLESQPLEENRGSEVESKSPDVNFEEKAEIKKKKEEERKDLHVEDVSVRINCHIQGMDRYFRPNGSYETIDFGNLTLNEAINIIKRLPTEKDFPPHLLRELKEGYDVCPPTAIFSYGDYVVNIHSEGRGNNLEVVVDGLSELAGYTFRREDPYTLNSQEVKREEVEKIVTEFYRRIDEFKKIGFILDPFGFSILMTIRHGISNTGVIAGLTENSIQRVRELVETFANSDLLTIHKKGFLRKKRYYEITQRGETILWNDKEKFGKVIKDKKKEVLGMLTIPLWVMYILNDLPVGISHSSIVELIGPPPSNMIELVTNPKVDLTFDVEEKKRGGEGEWIDMDDGDMNGW